MSSTPPKSNFHQKSENTFRNEIKARTIVQIFVWITVSILLFTPFALLDIPKNLQTQLNIIIGFFGIAASLISDQILTATTGKRDRDIIADSHDQIIAAIEGSSQVQSYSNHTAFERHIKHRIFSAIEVKNTFVSFKAANGNPNATDSATIESYKNFFLNQENSKPNDTKRWTDIVSYNEFFGPRYRELQKAFAGQKICGRHIARVIRHNMPMMNFTIFYFDSITDEREVVFGWIHSDATSNRRLFRSSDPRIVDMFEDVFHLVSQYRIQDDVELKYEEKEIRRGSKLSDRKGLWYTRGFGENGESDPYSEGIFNIEFKEDGVEIDGQVIWENNYAGKVGSVEVINHKPEKISYTMSKMFLEYHDPASGRRGICVYNFSTTREGAVLSGYLQDSDKDHRIQIRGVRVDDELLKNSHVDDELLKNSNDVRFPLNEELLCSIRHAARRHPFMQAGANSESHSS